MSNRLDAAIREFVEALAEAVRTEAVTRPATPDRLYSIDEAAGLLGIGRSRTYQEIAAGRLASLKVGRRRLVPLSAVRAFIEDAA